jgi:hypothetical protein
MNSILQQWKTYIEIYLNPIVSSFHCYFEGNIFSFDKTFHYHSDFLNKQLNLISVSSLPHISNILNIGFNSGNSTLLFLLSNPNSRVTCLDINEHPYVQPCFHQLKEDFGDRVHIIYGNSIQTLPSLLNKFDLIHIDGSLDFDIVNSDIQNSISLLNNHGIIVMDDYNLPHIKSLFDSYFNQQFHLFHNSVLNMTPDQCFATKKEENILPNICFYSCIFGQFSNFKVFEDLPITDFDFFIFTNNIEVFNFLQKTKWTPIYLNSFFDSDFYNCQIQENNFILNGNDKINNFEYNCYFHLDYLKQLNINKILNKIKKNNNKIIFALKHNCDIWNLYFKTISFHEIYYRDKEKYKDFLILNKEFGFDFSVKKVPNVNILIRKNTDLNKFIDSLWQKNLSNSGLNKCISFYFLYQSFETLFDFI